MDIEEFVHETLLEIMRGIAIEKEESEADESTRLRVGRIRGRQDDSFIDFDIAVSADESNGTEGSPRLHVLGGEAAPETRSDFLSRVKFSVPVVFPAAE